MKKWNKQPASVKQGIITGACAIIAAFIGGLFLLSSNRSNDTKSSHIAEPIRQETRNNTKTQEKNNKIEINWGPFFVCKNEAEKSSKQPFILFTSYNDVIKKQELEFLTPANSRIFIKMRSGVWSQATDDSGKVLLKILGKKCEKTMELSISKHIDQNNPSNFNDPSLMKEEEGVVLWDCHEEIKRIELYVNPGTYAVSINSIKISTKE